MSSRRVWVGDGPPEVGDTYKFLSDNPRVRLCFRGQECRVIGHLNTDFRELHTPAERENTRWVQVHAPNVTLNKTRIYKIPVGSFTRTANKIELVYRATEFDCVMSMEHPASRRFRDASEFLDWDTDESSDEDDIFFDDL